MQHWYTPWVLKQLYNLSALTVGALLVASCATGDGDALEAVDEVSEAQACICPRCPPANDCASFLCDRLTCVCQPQALRKEGAACTRPSGEAGVCANNVCCQPGCADLRGGCMQCPDDGNECTAEYCRGGVCGTQLVADGVACAGGTCAGGKCCTGCVDANGACRPGTALGACGAGGGACAPCSDLNPCTSDVCLAGRCSNPALANGTSCEADNNRCNGTSTCQAAKCTAGAELDCDDRNPCTDDSCSPSGGCLHVNNSAPCNDGNTCTLQDQCRNGACQPGSGQLVCDDGEPCSQDACDPIMGCVSGDLPDGQACDDGTTCTTASECRAGKCTGTAGNTQCEDMNPCTRAVCVVGATACSTVPVPNVDCNVDKCMTGQTCNANGVCAGGTAVVCDDGNPCTDDACDASTGCTFTNNDELPCGDGDACTEADHCDAGECVGTAAECAPLDDCHEAGACDPDTGTCSDRRLPAGTPCEADSGRCSIRGICVTNVTDGGAGGTDATGEAGADNEPGEGGSASGGEDSQAGSGNGGGGGVNSAVRGNKFVRDAGGCACSVPTPGGGVSGWAGAGLALAGLSLLGRRRRVRADANREM